MMVRPRGALGAELLDHFLGDLRPEAQLMDLVREGMSPFDGAFDVIV